MRDEKLTRLAHVQPGDVIACSCGAAVGTLVEVGGRLWLCVGPITIEWGRGRCSKCLNYWHFDTGDIQLARLVSRTRGENGNSNG